MSKIEVDTIEPSTGTSLTIGASGDTVTISSGATISNSGTATGFETPSYRNLIINGDMSVSQRGTQQTGMTVSQYPYAPDRFHYNLSSAGTWTVSQSTDVPSGQGFGYSEKFECTTANGSLGAGSYAMMRQIIEAQMVQHLKYGTSNAESITLSFWVKSNKTGTYSVWLYQDDDGRSIANTYTISAADTWEKKTITYSPDTTGVIDNNNENGLRVNFYLVAGTNFTSGTLATSWESDTAANRAVGQVNLADSTSNYINFTGIQLEVGTVASAFEFLPYDVNLQRCMRYYFNHYTPDDNGLYGLFTAHTSSAGRMPYRFIVPMRDAPTVGSSTASGFTWLGNNTSGNPSAIGSESLNKYSCTVNITGSFTQGYSYWLAGSTSTQLNFDAEL